MSPWIRRALIAGGFGIGTSKITIPHEIAPVVPYRGGIRNDFISNEDHQPDDTEAQAVKHDNASQDSGDHSGPTGSAPLYAEDTPFIHFDLAYAVRAAESSLRPTLAERDIKK